MRKLESIQEDLQQLIEATPEERACIERLETDLVEACQNLLRYEKALQFAARTSADLLTECNLARIDREGGNSSDRENAQANPETFLQRWKARFGIAETQETPQEKPAAKPEKPKDNREPFFGLWADLRRDYLKEYQPAFWQKIIDEDREEEYLVAFDDEMQERADRLEKQMAPKFGLTEDLKERDPMAWVGTYNNLRQAVREILEADIYSPVLEEND